MALATRQKPKHPQKKRRALHHRHSRHYLKTYLPYLPVLAIVGLGALVNYFWNLLSSPGAQVAAAAGPVMRIDSLLQSQTPWGMVVVAITFLAFAFLVFRHGFRIHRTINRGEYFVVHHPWVDVAVVAVVTAGVVLTRANF
jgi:hypothetical protein